MDNLDNIKNVLAAYNLSGNFIGCEKLTDGHIHSTYRVEYEDGGKAKNYLLQNINTYVFKDIEKLMRNVKGVTEYLGRVITENGGDADRECLRLFSTKDGDIYYTDEKCSCWRLYNYINGIHTVQQIENKEVFYNAARAFGTFRCLLADYPINSLEETTPDFHNTVSRFADFKKALSDNLSGRTHNAVDETEFILARESDCSVLVTLLNKGELPLTVTHNDTKLNNVLFDDETNEGICIVDLDTVMPGLSLYDFGDSIRFGANTASEDEKDVSKVSLSLELFDAYTKGYLEAAGKSLTPKEIEYLPFSAKLMTLECGMRFLGDYFNGDVYFHTEYPEHNLVRARTQLALVADIEKKTDEMKAIVEKYRKEFSL
ncbi:MAG: aminoglycoside phosphotransferase family protein [Clostridia bacterium]|nr:aminoglycoside phosphotransferase family protein [Clostridia bacterium]